MMNFTEWLSLKEAGHLGDGSGVQQWSAGPLYPLRIQLKVKGSGPGKVQVVVPSGKVVAEEDFKAFEIDFIDAFQRAEKSGLRYKELNS